MTTDDLLAEMADRPLCFSCLAEITAALEREALLALFACNIESTVDICVACKRDTHTTYRFRTPLAETAAA